MTLSKISTQVEAAAESVEPTEQRQNGMQLTQKQFEILYEESEHMTTNATPAVYGHVPHGNTDMTVRFS